MTDAADFRAEARAWIADNFPSSQKDKGAGAYYIDPRTVKDADYQIWRKRLADKGWGVPTWPVEYGGAGLTPAQAAIIKEELAAAGAFNSIEAMGTMMFGPTLLEY